MYKQLEKIEEKKALLYYILNLFINMNIYEYDFQIES